MGANNTKVAEKPIVNEKFVIERLRAMEIEEQSENEYVYIEGKCSRSMPLNAARIEWKREPSTLSASDIEQWQHKLLEDPKNRFVCHNLSSLSKHYLNIGL